MPPLLTGRMIAGQPCLDLALTGSSSNLTCQIDTFGDYEILLPAYIAQSLNFRPGLYLANHRLLDGRYIRTRTGTLSLTVPWAPSPQHVGLRILRAFNIVGHPPTIQAFLGGEFFKKQNRGITIDYANNSVHIS